MRTRSVYLLFISIISVILFIYIYRNHERTPRRSSEVVYSGSIRILSPAEISYTLEDDDRGNDEYAPNESIKSQDTDDEEENSSTIATKSQMRKTHIRDILNFPNKLMNFDFGKCDMTTCFDLTRCNTSDTLKVNIIPNPSIPDSNDPTNVPGESNIIHRKILQIIRHSKHYEPDPNKACLFVLEDDLLDRDPLSTSFRRSSLDIFRPESGYGMNYLIFNLYSGTWPDYRENDFSGFKLGGAILAKASNSDKYHRKSHDISIPLFSYLHPTTISTQVQKESENRMVRSNKLYLLTFKGKRYVIGSGSETRNSLYHLNNGRDVIMLTTCRHGKKWRDVEDQRCVEEEQGYDKHDFVDLMTKSNFCLTPRGRRLGSFRFLEALNHTCIPVVLSNGWVWPFNELINWTDAAIQMPEEDLLIVTDQLRDYSNITIKAMHARCHELYNRYFASVDKIVMTVLEIIERRIKLIKNK